MTKSLDHATKQPSSSLKSGLNPKTYQLGLVQAICLYYYFFDAIVFMPLQKKRLKKFIFQLSKTEIERALKWIDNISEKKMIEPITEIKLAQFLFENFLRERESDSKKNWQRSKK